MPLQDYERDMAGCSRCSSCKWLPLSQIKSWRFAKNCPAITRYNHHAYSGGGKLVIGSSLLQGRSELSEAVADILLRCTQCGACDVACKVYRDDIDLLEVIQELRAECVKAGRVPSEQTKLIQAMKSENNVFGAPMGSRGRWAEGMDLAELSSGRAEIILFIGCRFSYDQDLWGVARAAAKLLREAGVDFAVAGREESCCGARAYEMGFREEAVQFAEDVRQRVRACGAKTIVSICSDCYSAFKCLYPMVGQDLGVEVLHVAEYIERLLDQERLKLTHRVPMIVTYHDPCHLGRRGEPCGGKWQGDKLLRPTRQRRTGAEGVYDAPRMILRGIPGLELVEMERIREYSWCCGAGGGVWETFPDFSSWTATERIAEARETGAEAIVTACGWCERNFRDAISEGGHEMRVYDVLELVSSAVGV
jgi:Fe-S oxidoreductase